MLLQLLHIYLRRKISRKGIESTAQIHPSAIVADNAYIGHYAVIGEHCVIGHITIIQAHAFIDDEVEIGK